MRIGKNLYHQIRKNTELNCEPLIPEDFVVQPADFVSPPKWHLAHTSWFFEEFILSEYFEGYRAFDESFKVLFNSYYKSKGEHWLRKNRGHLSRPPTSQIMDYRRYVDHHMNKLLESENAPEIQYRIDLGLNHEQQHQELLFMDIKYILSQGRIRACYNLPGSFSSESETPLRFVENQGGIVELGHESTENKFQFDNETPRFKFFLADFALANRPVTNREFLAFIEDGGYQNPLLWKSDGWDFLNAHDDRSPLYWENKDGKWYEFTLQGELPLELDLPVCHLNYYEADAFAAWSGARLPTEMEFEHTYNSFESPDIVVEGQGFLESGLLRPSLRKSYGSPFLSLTGNLWEWSASSYLPYPGYRKPAGAFGEYNQKFMVNQMVLRGGCFATPRSHFRNTYRNYFYPHQKWAFTGLRLAKDVQ